MRYAAIVTFEFDPDKSAKTKSDPNRGIDFVEAQVLWKDANRVEVDLPFTGELRVRVTGRIGEKLWTAIITQRGQNVRIISVRRAHPKEENDYERQD